MTTATRPNPLLMSLRDGVLRRTRNTTALELGHLIKTSPGFSRAQIQAAVNSLVEAGLATVTTNGSGTWIEAKR